MVVAKLFWFSQVYNIRKKICSPFRYMLQVCHPILSFARVLGVTSVSMLQDPKNSIQPDFYANKISDFLSIKATAV